MKYLIISLAFFLNGCQWIVTHPTEDAEIIEIVEEMGKDIYEYETHTISATPPQPTEEAVGPSVPKQ